MSYKIDLLIIYANNDNSNGWVDNFKKSLDLMLEQVMGEKLNILLKNEHDSLTAANQKEIAACTSILSNDFLNSPSLVKFIDDFAQIEYATSQNPIFKVYKERLTSAEVPESISGLNAYHLYESNPDAFDGIDDADYFKAENIKGDFWMKMIDLAYDVHELINVRQNKQIEKSVTPISVNKKIYLADTGRDLSIQRNIIKRELQRHGYKVFPEGKRSYELDELKRNIQSDIDECDISIHLVGLNYGEIPDGSEKSIMDIQNHIAVEKAKRDKSFNRLIWISKELSNIGGHQKSFIESMKRDAEGSGIYQTSLEDFKNILREHLSIFTIKNTLNFLSVEQQRPNGQPQVYLMHDKIDEKEAKKLASHIKKAGYSVLTPIFDGELLSSRQNHINNLQIFDAAIVYQNKVNDQWLHMKVLDLLKAPGYGRSKPIKGKAVISEHTPDFIKTYQQHDIMVIDGEKEDKLNSIDEFLKNLD